MKKIKKYERQHKEEIDDVFHQLNLGNVGNVIYWWKFFEMIESIEGDVVECGVGRGRSLIVISALNYFLDKNEGGGRKIFAYDSFEGFPEPTDEDKSNRKPKKGEWSSSPTNKYKYSVDFTNQVLSDADIPINEMSFNIKKGYFCDSLIDHPDRPIALLHVDGDLYQSYKDVLENLYSRVSAGGIIVFDDFIADESENEDFPGARLAVEEFLGCKVKDLKISVGGTNYLIKE